MKTVAKSIFILLDDSMYSWRSLTEKGGVTLATASAAAFRVFVMRKFFSFSVAMQSSV